MIVPDQIRAEIERNLSDDDMKQFYYFLVQHGVTIDFAPIPEELIAAFERKGLKKGDAKIGAFCEWRQIDVIVSENRDFLRGLAPDHYFKVMSAEAFCQLLGL